MYYRFSAQETL